LRKLLSQTRCIAALVEMAQESIRECIKHCYDVRTVEGKPCVITLKIKVVPNRTRDFFGFSVTRSNSMSPFESADSFMHAEITDDGEVAVAEPEPASQTSMPVH